MIISAIVTDSIEHQEVFKEMLTTIITHKGNLSFKQFSLLVGQLKEKKDEYDIDVVIYKKLITLVIEILENVLKYSVNFVDFTIKNPQFQPEFNLLHNGENYMVETVNPVKESDINLVRQRIDTVNRLDYEKLRLFYRETLANGKFSEQGGAGLGFIEMAKIASEPLSYTFERISDNYYNFKLHMRVRK
jgi:hypothetical protein